MSVELDDLAEVVSETLEALSDDATARRLRKQLQPLRGIRGVSPGEVARVGASVWEESQPPLPRAGHALTQLFGRAWEDGLVAIGLLAAALPDAPAEALALGLEWAERIDDVATADALGWLVLGPSALMLGNPLVQLDPVLKSAHPIVRRAAAISGLAWLPEPVEGPSAAPLRARFGQRRARWVDAPQSPLVDQLLSRLLRDEAPEVRKGLRRVLRVWTASDPEAVVAWADHWNRHGGLPRMLSDETRRAARWVSR